MCRMAWFPPQAARNKDTLAVFLSELERVMGGDGNGVATINQAEKTWEITRGVSLSCEQCAEIIVSRKSNEWGVFHTRAASTGHKETLAEIHPHAFIINTTGRKLLMTHNGTWSGWKIAKLIFSSQASAILSDSIALGMMCTTYGPFQVLSLLHETVCLAYQKDTLAKMRLMCYAAGWDLCRLKDGTIASQGLTVGGEFEKDYMLDDGWQNMEHPRKRKYQYQCQYLQGYLSSYSSGNTGKATPRIPYLYKNPLTRELNGWNE